MKKVFVIFFAFYLLIALAGCLTERPARGAQGGIPEWVLRARNNAPDDVIVGVGTASLATMHQSMTVSETRARGQVVRAMDSMVRSMVTDYTATNEVDPATAVAFQQQIETSLARAQLQGARIAEQNYDRNGQWWTVIYFDRASVVNEINQAQAAARLAVPAMLAFNAEERMDEQFRRAAEEEWFGYD